MQNVIQKMYYVFWTIFLCCSLFCLPFSDCVLKCFRDIGRCYRMGGDEFNVLLENGDLYLCKKRLAQLQEMVAKCDKVGGFRMGIACGYKMYDRLLGYDIHETARRADKVMYQDKFAMKEL